MKYQLLALATLLIFSSNASASWFEGFNTPIKKSVTITAHKLVVIQTANRVSEEGVVTDVYNIASNTEGFAPLGFNPYLPNSYSQKVAPMMVVRR